ncbi:putative Pyroglutamyl-peptidase 1, partial [Hypsibius exemplaris]
YHRPDVDACVPLRGYCVANDGENCITTGVNLDGLHTWFEGAATDRSPEQSQHGATLQCQMSEDAGRFLCEFIYYTSLRINEKATLFIHVPPLDKPFGAAEIADAIKTVILRVCEQNNFTATTEEAAAKNFHITGVPHLDVSPKPAQTTNDESFHIADVQHMMLDEMQNALQ